MAGTGGETGRREPNFWEETRCRTKPSAPAGA